MQLGALVSISSSDQSGRLCFLVPAGFNLHCVTPAGLVLCVTPDAPLVRHGLGLCPGDEYPVQTQDRRLFYQIDAIW